MNKTTKALLDIFTLAKEADENLQYYWHELETVINADILEKLNDALANMEQIQKDIIIALGGTTKFQRLQNENEYNKQEIE